MLSTSEVVRSRLLAREGGEEVYELFIGPQHPSSGHMRFIVRLDGDVIVSVDPDIGYVHRTMEKLAEGREAVKAIPLLERMTIIDSHNVTIGLVRAMEKLLDVEPPPRARYLRTLLSEINRIASHLYGIGIAGIMLNHSTMFMWAFGDRE
ncbi:MAG: NADH-quinone oxidoreductase subunit NuoD, partial [Thermofilum sp.]